MRVGVLLAAAALTVASFAQGQLDVMTNTELGEKIRQLADQGTDTYDEQVRLVWVLVMRSVQGDGDAHKVGKKPAERLRSEKDLNFRARFAYGYFRYREAYDTRDPITRKRRLDEGRRQMTEAVPMGRRNADFLFDAGLIFSGLRRDVDLYRSALNTLTLAKRMFEEKFGELSKPRQADWYAAMANAFDMSGLDELARDHYQQAYDLAPDSLSGRKALVWLRSHGGGAGRLTTGD
ncbi:MAG: hypothetical protein IH851_10015 [Armatimonadetes bacterium]|nr:hypothetical protein [Armatimonadota bacterium]